MTYPESNAESPEAIMQNNCKKAALKIYDDIGKFYGASLEIDLILPRKIEVRFVDDEQLYKRFPALVEANNLSTTVNVHNATFEELEDSAEDRSISSYNVARLYIGAGIVQCAADRLVKPSETIKIERLCNVLGNVDELTAQVNGSHLISLGLTHEADDNPETDNDQFLTALQTEQQRRADILLGVMQSSDKRLLRLNGLRFAVGLVFEIEKNNSNGKAIESIQQSFLSELITTLAGKDNYVNFQTSAVGSNEMVAENKFAEGISDIELAIVFPMKPFEVQTILKICQQPNGQLEPDVLSGVKEIWAPKLPDNHSDTL